MNLLLAGLLLLQLTSIVIGLYYPTIDLRVGQTLDTTTSYFFKPVPSLCDCRQLCLEEAQCIAFQAEPFSYRWKCFLFKYGQSYKILNETSATVKLGVKTVSGSSLEADGLYYYIYPSLLNYADAKVACQQIGFGYQLALPKTRASFNVAAAYANKIIGAGDNNYLLVDLLRNSTNIEFGDGTPFNQTEIGKQVTPTVNSAGSTVFMILGSAFNDWYSSNTFTVLCQGNPLEI